MNAEVEHNQSGHGQGDRDGGDQDGSRQDHSQGEQEPCEQRQGEPRDRITALDKALAVLDVLTSNQHSMGLPDVTAKLGYKRQTVHRVLQQLEANGLVLRDPSRERFSLGPRFNAMALAALVSRNNGAPVRAILADLVADIEETCNVGVLDGLEFHYLERIECHWPLRIHLQAGSRVPAYCTSGGKVMMAYLEPKLCDAILRSKRLENYSHQTITRVADLQEEFNVIRDQGYALNDQEYTLGIIGAAVPILDGAGRALAALALHGPATRLPLARAQEVVPQLQAVAKRLSKVWEL